MSLERRNELTPVESREAALTALLALLSVSQTLLAWVELLYHRSELIEILVVVDRRNLDAFQALTAVRIVVTSVMHGDTFLGREKRESC